MSPAVLERLDAALDFVLDATMKACTAAEIIHDLQRLHGAAYVCQPHTNILRVAGVSASCTWSHDHGLLKAWRRNATIRIAKERQS